jgi:GNAT superfamily N-acetyltransferase
MLDDPTAPTIYRTSGSAPYPDPHDPQPALPADIFPRQVTLRDRTTVATLLPFSSYHQIPDSLLRYLCDQLNKEIEGGDTYPMIDQMPYDKFNKYWFQNFAAVMLIGNVDNPHDVNDDWSKVCLGSFYIKPNYPGRSSHVCNAGFLVTDAARNRGVGRLMGETYIDWAPKLGYTYSVFNLVYETNVASCRIWDALGFKRIGRVKNCGNLKSYPDHLVDAIIYGRDLGPDAEDYVSEARFDKIRFYLKHQRYPNGADRAEKSRLRSAATHYKLLENDKLMLKDKEVISDPGRQYEIARRCHGVMHGGINKTTAMIAEQYHWIRIKETVSLVIRNCDVCKEMGKVPAVRADGVTVHASAVSKRNPLIVQEQQNVSGAGGGYSSVSSLPEEQATAILEESQHDPYIDPFSAPQMSGLSRASVTQSPHSHSLEQGSHSPRQILQSHDIEPHFQQHPHSHHPHHHAHLHHPHPQLHHHPQPSHSHPQHHHESSNDPDSYIALDPRIMEDVRNHLGNYIDADKDYSHSDEDMQDMPKGYPSHSHGHDHVNSEVVPPYHYKDPFHADHFQHILDPDSAQQPENSDGSGLAHAETPHHHVSNNTDLDMLIEDDDDGTEDEPRDLKEQRMSATQLAARAAEAVMRHEDRLKNHGYREEVG